MDINLSTIKNLLAGIAKKNRHQGKPIISPFRDWKIMIVVFVLINIATISLGARTFYEVEYGEIAQVEDSFDSIVTIDRSTLDDVLDYYEAREESFGIMKTSRVTTVDPSR